MKLFLRRSLCGETFTRGELYVNGIYECLILEDKDRKLEEGGEKVYGQTCIPRGTYKVIVSYSNRFKRELPLLIDVPGFSGVRVHPGNTVEDTDGCLLTGVKDDTREDRVIMSRVTFDGVWKRIEAAFDAGEEITLEIV